jgi:hypothetical protein
VESGPFERMRGSSSSEFATRLARVISVVGVARGQVRVQIAARDGKWSMIDSLDKRPFFRVANTQKSALSFPQFKLQAHEREHTQRLAVDPLRTPERVGVQRRGSALKGCTSPFNWPSNIVLVAGVVDSGGRPHKAG